MDSPPPPTAVTLHSLCRTQGLVSMEMITNLTWNHPTATRHNLTPFAFMA